MSNQISCKQPINPSPSIPNLQLQEPKAFNPYSLTCRSITNQNPTRAPSAIPSTTKSAMKIKRNRKRRGKTETEKKPRERRKRNPRL
jgi:hypothetical protein